MLFQRSTRSGSDRAFLRHGDQEELRREIMCEEQILFQTPLAAIAASVQSTVTKGLCVESGPWMPDLDEGVVGYKHYSTR